jgi:hypothetical protein
LIISESFMAEERKKKQRVTAPIGKAAAGKAPATSVEVLNVRVQTIIRKGVRPVLLDGARRAAYSLCGQRAPLTWIPKQYQVCKERFARQAPAWRSAPVEQKLAAAIVMHRRAHRAVHTGGDVEMVRRYAALRRLLQREAARQINEYHGAAAALAVQGKLGKDIGKHIASFLGQRRRKRKRVSSRRKRRSSVKRRKSRR